MRPPCDAFRETIRALADGTELVVSDEMASHLDDCSHCRRLFDLGKVDLAKDSFEVLSDDARRRLVESLSSARLSRPARRGWVTGVAVAATIIVAVGTVLLLWAHPTSNAVAAALVEDHVRYLDSPERHNGGDPATLKSYLEAYVDFPVEVHAPSFTRITGCRRCLALGRRVALIFYDTPDGPASYLVLAADGIAAPGHRCRGEGGFLCGTGRGYHLVAWKSDGLLHVFVGSRQRTLIMMADACRASTTN